MIKNTINFLDTNFCQKSIKNVKIASKVTNVMEVTQVFNHKQLVDFMLRSDF